MKYDLGQFSGIHEQAGRRNEPRKIIPTIVGKSKRIFVRFGQTEAPDSSAASAIKLAIPLKSPTTALTPLPDNVAPVIANASGDGNKALITNGSNGAKEISETQTEAGNAGGRGINNGRPTEAPFSDEPEDRNKGKSVVEYEELPWDGNVKSYTEISNVPADMSAEAAIAKFQQETFEQLQDAIGTHDYDSHVEELHNEFERYGLPLAPVLFVPFSDQNVQNKLYDLGFTNLADILRSKEEGGGFLRTRYGIGFVNNAFVNPDLQADIDDVIRSAAHESGGHGTSYSKYLYKRSPDNTFYFRDTNIGARNEQVTSRDPVFRRGFGFASTAEELISEWRSGLVVESLGHIPPTQTRYVYFDPSEHHGEDASKQHINLAPNNTVAIPYRYNLAYGPIRSYGPIATAADMLVNRDPNNPDVELFKAIFYGNVSIQAIQALEQRLTAIDPQLKEFFFSAIVSPTDWNKRFNGKELALYMHQHMTRWTAEAVEAAAAVTRGLLQTLAK